MNLFVFREKTAVASVFICLLTFLYGAILLKQITRSAMRRIFLFTKDWSMYFVNKLPYHRNLYFFCVFFVLNLWENYRDLRWDSKTFCTFSLISILIIKRKNIFFYEFSFLNVFIYKVFKSVYCVNLFLFLKQFFNGFMRSVP